MTASDDSLSGRVALVTGGARGIGLAVSRRLHELGASVVIADSGVSIAGEEPDASVAESASAELGERAAAFTSSLADPEAAAGAVSLALARFGFIDLVVNNAAIVRGGFVFKTSWTDWDAVLRNNLSAAFYVLSAATPHLREQAKAGRAPGRIVNVTSSTGLYGNFGQSAYASSKAGLVGLTRVVALEMARSGVTCNAVVPFAATRVTDAIRPANEAQAQYKARAVSIAPRFVADLVASLCASEARDVTGQVIGVRGREVFLFSQPRPIERVVVPEDGCSGPALATTLHGRFLSRLTELTTDLEAFNTDPIV
jgi:NAD(P)-dependent dehydrogenase (short-subunit alcohol dehydrogenase family)